MNRGDLSNEQWETLQPLLPPLKPRTGKPITFLLSSGQLMKSIFLEQLMEQGAVKRSGRGRPRLSPQRVVGDKGYTGHRIRSYFTEVRYPFYHPTTVTLSHVAVLKAREIYRQRNSELNVLSTDSSNASRIATRYEKLAANYTAMMAIACIWLWL